MSPSISGYFVFRRSDLDWASATAIAVPFCPRLPSPQTPLPQAGDGERMGHVTISASVAAEAVEAGRVVVQDLAALLVGQPDWQGAFGCIEVPVRVVGREHQQRIRIDLLEDLLHQDWIVRQIERLEREAHPLLDVLRGQLSDPRRLATQPLPDLVEAPEEAGQPGPTAFDHRQAERRELVE